MGGHLRVPVDTYLENIKRHRPEQNVWLLELALDSYRVSTGDLTRRRSVRERARLWGCNRATVRRLLEGFPNLQRFGPKTPKNADHPATPQPTTLPPDLLEKFDPARPGKKHPSDPYYISLGEGPGDGPPPERGATPLLVVRWTEAQRTAAHELAAETKRRISGGRP